MAGVRGDSRGQRAAGSGPCRYGAQCGRGARVACAARRRPSRASRRLPAPALSAAGTCWHTRRLGSEHALHSARAGMHRSSRNAPSARSRCFARGGAHLLSACGGDEPVDSRDRGGHGVVQARQHAPGARPAAWCAGRKQGHTRLRPPRSHTTSMCHGVPTPLPTARRVHPTPPPRRAPKGVGRCDGAHGGLLALHRLGQHRVNVHQARVLERDGHVGARAGKVVPAAWRRRGVFTGARGARGAGREGGWLSGR